jgi:Popeye protein conserved region
MRVDWRFLIVEGAVGYKSGMGALSGQTVAEILTHISCALSFGAFLVRDMLWLRILAIVSSLVWIAAMAANNWITASFFWNGVFIAINTYNIGVLLNENRSVSFTDEERELYETLFRSFRPGEFLKVIRIAKWRNATPGELLLREGGSVDGVGLIMEGSAEVTLPGEHRPHSNGRSLVQASRWRLHLPGTHHSAPKASLCSTIRSSAR